MIHGRHALYCMAGSRIRLPSLLVSWPGSALWTGEAPNLGWSMCATRPTYEALCRASPK